MNRAKLRQSGGGGLVAGLLLLSVAAAPARATGSIAGTLKVPPGRSVQGALVNALDRSFHAFRSEVGADGTYSIQGLEAGSYTVVAVGGGLEPAIARDVVVQDGGEVRQDLSLLEPQPYCIVKSPQPIPLTDDYYSAAFADAAEIRVDAAWQIVLGIGPGTLLSWNPSEVSGRFKLKFSDLGIHLAADLTFQIPGAHNWPMAGDEVWDGNSLDLTLQNDAYDPNRQEYDLDHDWHIIVGLGDQPVWKLFQAGYPPEDENNLGQSAAEYVRRQVKPTNDGELVRIDFPWSRFRQNKSMSGAIPVPRENALGAIDLSINGADPHRSRDKAAIKNRLSWSGFLANFLDPRVLRPARFCPQPP